MQPLACTPKVRRGVNPSLVWAVRARVEAVSPSKYERSSQPVIPVVRQLNPEVAWGRSC